jgi:co-chaperonin GroES (HSP10)
VIEMHLSVRGARVLVRTEEQKEHVNPSGVIVVESHAPEVIGTVIACGQDVCEVREGDVVLFSPAAGREIEWNGQRYLALDEDEILATWNEEKQPE